MWDVISVISLRLYLSILPFDLINFNGSPGRLISSVFEEDLCRLLDRAMSGAKIADLQLISSEEDSCVDLKSISVS